MERKPIGERRSSEIFELLSDTGAGLADEIYYSLPVLGAVVHS